MIGVELIDEDGKPLPAARTASIFEGTKVILSPFPLKRCLESRSVDRQGRNQRKRSQDQAAYVYHEGGCRRCCLGYCRRYKPRKINNKLPRVNFPHKLHDEVSIHGRFVWEEFICRDFKRILLRGRNKIIAENGRAQNRARPAKRARNWAFCPCMQPLTHVFVEGISIFGDDGGIELYLGTF